MIIDFPYPGYERIAPVEVPDENLSGVHAPRSVGQAGEEEVLAGGFAEPYGAPRLRDAVRPTDRVLVLVDDATRGTPVPRLLKRVVGELWAAGVSDGQIRLLTAQEALGMAFERQGRGAQVAVLRHGGHVLPLVEGEAAEANA